jgi:undecaprenyl diphosphate synthase
MLDFTIPSVLRMNDLDRIAPPGTSARTTLESLDLEALPRHVAVIMDGNGRWARRRGRPRLDGHRAGARAVRSTVETAGRLGIQVLTLYAFSTENWKRPPREVNGLFSLLKDFVTRELNSFRDNNLRFRPIGDLSRLDTSVRNHLDRAVAETAECTGTLVQIALNYSGRHEITRMVRDAVAAARRGELAPDEVTEPWIDDHLDTAGTPDPDLMIRTSGSSASPTSCCGNWPTPRSSSPTSCGPTSTPRSSSVRWPCTRGVTVDSAASPREGRLFRRELFALIAVPVVVAAIVWAPVWVYQVALIAVVLAAGDEMIRMTRAGGLSTGRPVPLLVLTGVLDAPPSSASRPPSSSSPRRC